MQTAWTMPANTLCVVVAGGTVRPMPQKIVDLLPTLLDHVLQGTMDVREAAAAYGEQPPGPGRPRRFPIFADYLADRLRYAEDPAADGALYAMLVRSTDRRRYATKQARSAETVQINRLLDETGRERAASLRDLLAELGEPTLAAG